MAELQRERVFPPPKAADLKAQAAVESFDYIVIGAGAAGCILTRRLAEIDPAARYFFFFFF